MITSSLWCLNSILINLKSTWSNRLRTVLKYTSSYKRTSVLWNWILFYSIFRCRLWTVLKHASKSVSFTTAIKSSLRWCHTKNFWKTSTADPLWSPAQGSSTKGPKMSVKWQGLISRYNLRWHLRRLRYVLRSDSRQAATNSNTCKVFHSQSTKKKRKKFLGRVWCHSRFQMTMNWHVAHGASEPSKNRARTKDLIVCRQTTSKSLAFNWIIIKLKSFPVRNLTTIR